MTIMTVMTVFSGGGVGVKNIVMIVITVMLQFRQVDDPGIHASARPVIHAVVLFQP